MHEPTHLPPEPAGPWSAPAAGAPAAGPPAAGPPAAGPPAGPWDVEPVWESPESGGDELDIGRYLNALRRRWPIVLALCLLGGAYALLRFSLTPKEYLSAATIQIERRRLSLYAMGQAGWFEDWWNQEYYPTQYRLLKSRGMAERVVMNLRLFEDPAFTGRTPGELLPQAESTYTQFDDAAELARLAGRLQGGLRVEPITETQLVELTYQSTSPELAARVANGYAEAFIQWGIETRSTNVGRASTFLTAQIEALRDEIDERQMQLAAYTHDVDLGLDPAGEALVARRSALEERYSRAVTDRITREASYRELLNMSDEMIANTASAGRVTALEEEIFRLESDYTKNLETFSPEWPDMVELKSKIEKRREQLERLVRESVDDVRDRAYAEFQKARGEEGVIAEELRKLADESRQHNSAALEYNNLQTIIETRKELLNELLKRQSQTEVASRVESSQASNVRIVDRAVMPAQPFRPRLESSLTRFLLAGLVLGVSLIVLLEYFDRTIKTPEELEKILRLPNLAVIPDIHESRGRRSFLPGKGRGQGYGYGYGGYGYGGGVYGYGEKRSAGRGRADPKAKGDEPASEIELLPHRSSRLAICEAYRSLRTAILLSSARALRLVAVTSAEPGEGKTSTALNLAVVLAQLGRRVLVIDADLRRPRMHKILGVSNRAGLVSYLTGQVELQEVFHKTEVHQLYVCPSGPIPPNPSELLSSERMKACLEHAAEIFDIVLIDTPPVLPVADAVILGTQADGVVICARAGSLRRDDARVCRERLKFERIKILGTVLNRYQARGEGYYRRRRYYGLYEESSDAAAHGVA